MTSFFKQGEVWYVAIGGGRERPAKRDARLNERGAEGAARGVGTAAARVDNGPGNPAARRPAAEVGRPPGGDPEELSLRSPQGRIGGTAPGMAANGSRDGAVAGVSPA